MATEGERVGVTENATHRFSVAKSPISFWQHTNENGSNAKTGEIHRKIHLRRA